MQLFFTKLPIYVLGNLHCVGMCGPLVALLGAHRHRHCYFLGRLLSFSLAGALAGGLGAVLNAILQAYHLPAMACFAFGAAILIGGMMMLLGWKLSFGAWGNERIQRMQQGAGMLLLRDTPLSTFAFGFLTVILPCGQTLIVFSACALDGDPLVGWLNGLAFAALTSPSLWLAMHARHWISRFRKYENAVMGTLAIAVGVLSLLRGFAELEIVPHLVLNPNSPVAYHIILY